MVENNAQVNQLEPVFARASVDRNLAVATGLPDPVKRYANRATPR
jgi:hypothetical protein